MNDTQRSLYARLINEVSWVGAYCGIDMNRLPCQGQMVVAGPCGAPDLYRIGYVVQIRLRQGAAGSHNLLLRHANGQLHQHSNNLFCSIAPEDEQALQVFFDRKPSEEDFSRGYTVDGSNETHATGYLIASRSDFPDEATPFVLPVTDYLGHSSQVDVVWV